MQTVAGKKPASHVTAHELAVELVTYARRSGSITVIREMEARLGEKLLNEACDAARRELREKEEREARNAFGLSHVCPPTGCAGPADELVGGARVTDEPCPSCKGSGRLRTHAVTYPRVRLTEVFAESAAFVDRARAGAITCGKCGRNDRNLHFDGKTLLGCDACRIGPYVAGEVKRSPGELEAMRERDQARAELDATHERLRHLEDQSRAAWIAVDTLHGLPGTRLGTLAGVIAWLKEQLAASSAANEDAWRACPHFPSGAIVGTLAEVIAFFRAELAEKSRVLGEAIAGRVELRAALASSEAAFHSAAKNEQTMCEQLTHVQTRCTELRAELEALRAGAAS